MNDKKELFDIWGKQKFIIDKEISPVFFKERDMFFIKMGQNIRFEQNGKGWEFVRPVVIIKKFNNDVFWGVALSTKIKDGLYYYCFDANGAKQCAIISQFRLYDKNRLIKKIGMIPIKDFFQLKQKIKNLL
ncbi:hypothetical protein P148_SR1C00001G1040 [candidate division SR1 bacterium RAAC1_SR1_1]|nr:hypothetical protein P148_SR1C00001G1040 [candidate division SR1 bacterium RAAC1_SR1_1]